MFLGSKELAMHLKFTGLEFLGRMPSFLNYENSVCVCACMRVQDNI